MKSKIFKVKINYNHEYKCIGYKSKKEVKKSVKDRIENTNIKDWDIEIIEVEE